MMRRSRRATIALVALLSACDGSNTDAPEGVSASTAVTSEATVPASSAAATTTAPPDADSSAVATTSSTGDERVASTAPPPPTTIDIESDDGRLVVGEMPPELADTAPVPPDADVDLVTTTDEGATFVATSPSSIEDVTDFYRSLVTDAGSEPTVTAIADGIVQVEGDTALGTMVAVLGTAPEGAVSITVGITS